MNIKSKIIYSLLAVAGLFTSCDDKFLERPPLSEISVENFYQTSSDLRLATAALYAGAPWGDWLYSSYLPVGEVLSGNMVLGWNDDAGQFNSFSVTGLNSGVISDWKGMYKIIAHCNTTINAIKLKAPSSLPAEDVNGAIAEAKFIRAYAYYNLVMLFRNVPIIEDNSKLIANPNVNRHRTEDVYQFIVNDLTFAAKNLPAEDEKGRVTTWSAQGMLAKVYLTWAGYDPEQQETVHDRNPSRLDSAKYYAGNVCLNSGLELMEDYAELFKSKNNDNPESLFALQWIGSTSDWLSGNMLQIYSSGSIDISANGNAGWFSINPTYDMFQQYEENDSVRRKATFMYNGDYYKELNEAGGGYTFKGNTGMKKHIIGTRADNNSTTMTLTSSVEHNSLLRLADVYLVYADAILGNNASTTDPVALTYFNKVRTRAGLNPLAELTTEIILKERRIELATEGHYWFDLVSLSYYNPIKALSYLDNPDAKRVPFTYADGVATPGKPQNVITKARIGTFTLPIPSSEVTSNPKLLEAAVPYKF